MGEYDTVPQEADDKLDALEEPEPGVAERTDGEEDAPEEWPSDRDDPISFSEDERSVIDQIFLSPQRFFDCLDVGCTWPCAHHLHTSKERAEVFEWDPNCGHLDPRHPEIPRLQSEMMDCQFCRIFLSIGLDDCNCSADESRACCIECAHCYFRSNGQLSHVRMVWTCGSGTYELGLPTGKVVWSLYDLSNKPF